MSFTHYRAQVAALSRDRSADDPQLIDARRCMRVEKLADQIAAVVDGWPEPTAEQRDRLAVLLRGGGGAA